MDRLTSPLTVSVIVPVYNGAETIVACLESLLAQDYPVDYYEIIVVENGSTDNTSDVVGRYPAVRLLHSPLRGPGPARNYGIARSEAKIIAFTDADCIAEPDWLTELVKGYTSPEIGGVGGKITAYEHSELTSVERFSCEHSPLINFVSGEDEFLPHLYTANASFLRELLNQVNGFNPRLMTAEDVDLSWRIQLNASAKLTYCDDAIIHHHHRATTKGLARQYRQYGFGEILLDTLYNKYEKYPRAGAYQVKRILAQLMALPRYVMSMFVRKLRFLLGRADLYRVLEPRYCFMIESNNIFGKMEGLIATRWMTDAEHALGIRGEELIERYFPNKKM